jgi:hypothetical protein
MINKNNNVYRVTFFISILNILQIFKHFNTYNIAFFDKLN